MQKLTNFSEKELEDHIITALTANGYQQGNPADFDKIQAIDSHYFWQFLHNSQQTALDTIAKHNPDWQKTIIHRLNNTIKKYGILHLLKKGLDVDNANLTFLYPKPLASSSQIARDNYRQNIFTVTRQVRYSQHNGNSVDLVIFLNGLAIITLELKSTHKNQTARFNAIEQYKKDRSFDDPLFNFARAIVHFTLDNQEAYMTTRLNGANTFFLPFNKGNHGNAGNPPNPNGFNTEYLWNEVLQPDSLVNLISHFVRLGCDNPDIKKPNLGDMTLYFPRYHQNERGKAIGARRRWQWRWQTLSDSAFRRVGQVQLHHMACLSAYRSLSAQRTSKRGERARTAAIWFGDCSDWPQNFGQTAQRQYQAV